MAKSPSSKITEILKQLLFAKDLRPMDLARITGLPQPTIQRIVAGTSSNPHLSTLTPIANFFGITTDQLKGDVPLPQLLTKVMTPTDASFSRVPIISWEEIYEWPENKDRLTLTQRKAIILENNLGRDAYAAEMPDSSMFPLFPKGTQLIIDPAKKPADRSFVIVKLIRQQLVVFRQLLIDASDYYLKPLSPDLESFKVTLMQPGDRICGVLVQSRNNFSEYAS